MRHLFNLININKNNQKEKKLKPKVCPFQNECTGIIPDGIDCPNEYEKCEKYARFVHWFVLAIPFICPYENKCQKQCTSPFIDGETNDYRDCQEFSQFFWKEKMQK